MQKQRLDLLAIGDITTDAFIRPKEASVHCDIDKKNCQLCMRFADKIPYEFVEVVRAVGNSPNAAVAAARLGLSSGLVATMGDDENGRECREALLKENVDTTYVSVQKGAKTNYHYVLWFEDERTILVKHEEYAYALPAIDPPPKWLYCSSLGGSSERYHYEIAAYLEKHPEVRFAFQPGTFQIKLGKEKLAKLYRRAELFFCNREEAERILSSSSSSSPFERGGAESARQRGSEGDMKQLLAGIHALGPQIVCITDGPKGAYCFDGHTNEYWFMPPYPDPKPPLNRTGAGDAFSSTFTAAIIWGKSVREALALAPINSAFVVQQVGAQRGLLSRDALFDLYAKAPPKYRAQKI